MVIGSPIHRRGGHVRLRFHFSCRSVGDATPAAANLIAMKCSAFLALLVVRAGAGRLGRRRRQRLVRRGREARIRAARRHHDAEGGAAAACRADGGRASAAASGPPFRARPRCARSPSRIASSPSIWARASRPAATADCSSSASASSSAPCAASRASAACRCSSTGGVPVGLFPGYDLSKPVAAPVDAGSGARAHHARHPAAADRSRLHGRLGTDGCDRYADIDGGARVPEMGEPAARRRARRLDRRRCSSGQRGPSPGCGCPAAGSRCSSAASSRC